jgi:nucleotide-binding universal stress UspA family protein
MKSKQPIRFKSIVVPIDFSETSIKALDYAVALAQEFGSRLCLVHVLDFSAVFNSAEPSYASWDREVKTAASNRLAALTEKKVDELIPATSQVILGRAFKSICEAAREQKADLIVIGTHGFTGLKRMLLGSTAERVVRHAPCSVLTVHGQHARNTKSTRKPKKILVPTDFSKPAEEALGSAVEIARQFQMRLQLLYVVPIHYATGEYDAVDFAMLAVEQKKFGQKQLAKISGSLAAKKIPVTTAIRHGRPATEIVEAAEEMDADLIAISTHGLTGWRRAVLGSTTEEVVRHATCPVLVVREK